MSAILGLLTASASAVHIVTDAALTTLDDGVLMARHPKQIVTRNGSIVVAGVGLWQPCVRFADLIDQSGKNFDELTAVASELWKKARADLCPEAKRIPYKTLFAGQSEVGPMLCAIQTVTNDFPHDVGAFDYHQDVEIIAGGPADEAHKYIASFVDRIAGDRDAFDARTHGLEFMETLRRHHPRQFKTARQPAVGGFISHSIVTRDGIETEIIHSWPDVVGHVIDLDAEDRAKADMQKLVAALHDYDTRAALDAHQGQVEVA